MLSNETEIDEQMNRDILQVLRQNTALSLENSPHLADTIFELEEAVAGIYEFILGEKVEVNASDLVEPSLESVESKMPEMMAIETFDEARLGYIALDKTTFASLLSFTLTGNLIDPGQDTNSVSAIDELSATELRILSSISQRLARAFMAQLSQTEIASLSRADKEILGTDFLEQQLVFLKFDAACNGFSGQIEFLLPLSMLESVSQAKNRNADKAAEELKQWAWQQKLLAGVAETPVKLLAELSTVELPITEVAMLQSGDSLPIELLLEEVPVMDEALNPMFVASMQFDQEEVILQVGPAISNISEGL